MDLSELSSLAMRICNEDSYSSSVRSLAKGAVFLVQRFNELERQLRKYRDPLNSVKFFVERHLSCVWDVSKDVDTDLRTWECSPCERSVPEPTPAIYSPCPEKLRLRLEFCNDEQTCEVRGEKD